MNRLWNIAFGILLLTSVETFGAQPLMISVGEVQAAPGQDVNIPITMLGARDIGALEIRFTADNRVLELKKVVEGEATENSLVASDIGEDPDKHLATAGFGFAQTKPVNDGVIFIVQAHVVGKRGDKSPLRIEAVQAWTEENENEISVSPKDGELTVAGFAWNPWWIAVAVAALLLLGGLLLLLARRGRRARPNSRPASADAIPTYGVAGSFKHQCSGCRREIELPASAHGHQFRCASCGAVQTG